MRRINPIPYAIAGLLVLAQPAQAIVTGQDPAEFVISGGQFHFQPNIVELTVHFDHGAIERCSGTLMRNGNVLTAAHCFEDSDQPHRGNATGVDIRFGGSSSNATMTSTQWELEGSWTGTVGDGGADLAVVGLPAPAPADAEGLPIARPQFFSQSTYDQLLIWIAGYGDAGQGAVDPSLSPVVNSDGTPGPGTPRMGLNHYDALPAETEPASLHNYLMFDFDDYSGANNKLGEAGFSVAMGENGPIRIDYTIDSNENGSFVLGESMIANGDSGGPSLVDIFIVGVHSFYTGTSVTPGTIGVDTVSPAGAAAFEVGFGSIGGDVMVAAYADWIDSVSFSSPAPAPVPLPTSLLLLSSALALMGAVTARRSASLRLREPREL